MNGEGSSTSGDGSESETTPPVSFDQVWARIVACEREFFRTHQGRLFTYRLDGNDLVPSHSEVRITRADLENVFLMLPVQPPQKLARHVAGYAFAWAVMHDPRISAGRW